MLKHRTVKISVQLRFKHQPRLSVVLPSSETLTKHLNTHPNKLYQLRVSVSFAGFWLMRYIACLESMFVPSMNERIPLFLLDFSDYSNTSIAQASQRSFLRVRQALTRFYSWSFGEQLKLEYSIAEQLYTAIAPEYRLSKIQLIKPSVQEEIERAKAVWEIASQRARQSDDPYTILGEAIYEMIAVQAEASPERYLRKLGERIGVLYPNRRDVEPRFRLNDDMLEMLIRSVVEPGVSLTRDELQQRLWERYRIVIGGLPSDENKLLQANIYDASEDDLYRNQQAFADKLHTLEFADLLADGVLKVEVARV